MVLGRNNTQKLQNDVFCLTEERNYFQSKYLEQISEITALQSELNNAKREIQKLREEVMTNSVASMSIKDENKEEDASTLTRLTTDDQPERQQVSISSTESHLKSAAEQQQQQPEDDDNAVVLPSGKQQQQQGETQKETTEPTDNTSVIDSDSESVEEEEEDDQEDDEEKRELDERAKLRMDAEKLLQWADYRSSRRSSFSSVASPSSSQRQTSLGVPRTIQSASLKEEVDEEMSMQD